jgi:hypothetical protein
VSGAALRPTALAHHARFPQEKPAAGPAGQKKCFRGEAEDAAAEVGPNVSIELKDACNAPSAQVAGVVLKKVRQ